MLKALEPSIPATPPLQVIESSRDLAPGLINYDSLRRRVQGPQARATANGDWTGLVWMIEAGLSRKFECTFAAGSADLAPIDSIVGAGFLHIF
jgi:hypothetical protein